MLRTSTLLFVSILLIGCNAYKPITVGLQPTDGTEQQVGVAHYFAKNTEPDSLHVVLANKLNLNLFVLSLFDYNPEQQEKRRPTHEYTSKTLFLTGLRGDSIFIIADENNNGRLDDDKIIPINKRVLELQSTKNLGNLPLVRIRNLQAHHNGQPHTFSKKFFLLPDTITTGKLALELISNEYLKGRFRYKGKRYYIHARQPSSGHFIVEPTWAYIRIDEKNDISNVKYNVSDLFNLYDTVRKGRNVFVIQSVSPFLDTVILQPLRSDSFVSRKINEHQTTFNENADQGKGKPYPYLSYFTDSATQFGGDYKNKVLFINFWFVNCPPCIAEFNALNNLYSNFKNDSSFKLISFTFESPEEIQKMRAKYSLLFDIYSISETEVNKLNLNNLFPTNILIDRKGIVKELFVGGEINSDNSDLFFKKGVLPKILKTLN